MSDVPPFPARPLASAPGPWPGTDPLEAARAVLGELGREGGLPLLPQLPERGPGSDPTGRAAAALVEMPVDLQPVGWRLVDHPGRDARRGTSHLAADVDALAEAADGYAGPLALGVLGPWSLAASVWLPRGERVVVDAGATRDLLASLAEGLAQHVRHVRRLVPLADVVLVLDEPPLPSVLGGRVPTASRWGRLPPLEGPVVRAGLRTVVDAATAAGARAAVRCPLPRPGDAADGGPGPDARGLLRLLGEAGATGLGVDWAAAAALGSPGWEAVAEAAETGAALWVALAPAPPGELVEALTTPWRRLGLDVGLLGRVVLEPAAGLAGLSPSGAREVLERMRDGAEALAQSAAA